MSNAPPDPPPQDAAARQPAPRHAIVAGFGPVGRLTADKLEAQGFSVTILERNLDTIERQLDLNKHVVFGSVEDEGSLRTAGIDTTDAVILAIPDEKVALQACRVVRRLRPDVFLAARANFLSQGMLCRQAGADKVIVEEVVTAEAMRDAVTEALVRPPTPPFA